MCKTVRNYLTTLAVAVLLICVNAYAEIKDNRKYLIDPASTTINGITVGTLESDILKRLGKPQLVENGYSEVESKPDKYLNYPGMKIYIIGGEIYNLSCTGKNCKTNSGIRIGSSKEKVIATYGKGNPPYKGSTHDSISYPFKGCDCYLVFLFKKNLVTEIEFFIDYV